MASYIALIHKAADSDYGVSFPDFPGCVTAGRDLDEARTLAPQVLALHVQGMLEDGEALPEPSSLHEIMRDRESRDAVAFMVPGPTGKTVRVNITLPEDVLHAIDRYAEEHGLTRSGFLSRAARREIDGAA